MSSELPKWAQDHLEAQRKMGEMETSAPIGYTIGILLGLSIRLALFLGGCAATYIIGKALVG